MVVDHDPSVCSRDPIVVCRSIGKRPTLVCLTHLLSLVGFVCELRRFVFESCSGLSVSLSNNDNAPMPRRKQEWAKRVKKERFRKRYLTRMQATRLLQLDSMNFRRLCILKGIYPRAIGRSKQKASGSDKQYYLSKEIKWLVHDQIRNKVQGFTSWEKKLRRAKSMHDFERMQTLQRDGMKPQYDLVATIKERYPTFADALKDVDDAMTNIGLYSFLTPEVKSETTVEFHHALSTGLHQKAKQVQADFFTYVSQSHTLVRAFISVKGYYYEAFIHGQRIIWLMPHEYASKFPPGVQQYILITFLEFQTDFMRFVVHKLQNELKKRLEDAQRRADDALDDHAADFTAQGTMEVTESGDAIDTTTAAPTPAAATSKVPQGKKAAQLSLVSLLSAEQTVVAKLFEKLVFYLSREVPEKHCRFIIEACGGRVVKDLGPTVTHYVVDRPSLLPPHKVEATVEYIQPQYLWDCLNSRMVLPAHGYRMGETLPPHVSPFTVAITNSAADNAAVEDVRKRHPKIVSYVPDRVHEIRALKDPNYSRIDPEGIVSALDDDAGSEASQDERMQLAPESDDDESLTGDQIRQTHKRAKWEDETVKEHAERTKRSALLVQKQRELNLLNKPTDDVVAAKKADRAKAAVERRVGETRDERIKRKLRDAIKQKAVTKKMRLQVAKSKSRKFYNMVNSVVKGTETHEKILRSKAQMLAKGGAKVSADGKTYTTAKEERSKRKEQARSNRSATTSGDAKSGGKSGGAAQKKKAKIRGPYDKLPQWVR